MTVSANHAGRPTGVESLSGALPWADSGADAASYLQPSPAPYQYGTPGWKPSGWSPERPPSKRPRVAAHGLINTYLKGCRCDDCKMAARDRQRRYRAKRKKQAESQSG